MNIRRVENGKNVTEKPAPEGTLTDAIRSLIRVVDVQELLYRDLKERIAGLSNSEKETAELEFLRRYRKEIRAGQLIVSIRKHLSDKGGRPTKINLRLFLEIYCKFLDSKEKPPSAAWLKERYNKGAERTEKISNTTAAKYLKLLSTTHLPPSSHDQKIIDLVRNREAILFDTTQKFLNEK